MAWILFSALTLGAQTPPSVNLPSASQLQGFVNQSFSLQLTATGGTTPYTFSASSLPPGLQMTSGGLISGVPVLNGDWTSQISVEDKIGTPNQNPASLTFSFEPFLRLQATTLPPDVTVNKPFVLGSISSFPGANVSLTLSDPWIKFETGSDTTCTKTASTITIPAGSSPTNFQACVSVSFVEYFAQALIKAVASGFPTIADGFLLHVGSSLSLTGNVNGDSVDLTSGAVEWDAKLTAGTFIGPPGITYDPLGGGWLEETDNCQGSASCSVLLSPSPLTSLLTGEQVAARLDFSSGAGAVGSVLAKYKYLPSTVSITSTAFSGVYNWPFSGTASAAGGTGPYSWLAAGLPIGLTISKAGVISGTPLQGGVTQSFLTATDSLGYTKSQAVTFTFDQGAPALALVAAATTPYYDSSSPPFNVGTLSSSPVGAPVTLSIASSDQANFGFPPDPKNPSCSVGTPAPTTLIVASAPKAVLICVTNPNPQPDAALRIYVHITATSPGFVPISVTLPLQSVAVYTMQVTSPLDISASGSGDMAVAVVSNDAELYNSATLTSWQANPSWITVTNANPSVQCLKRASCTFKVSADLSQLPNAVVGQTYSGSIIFKAGSLSAAAAVNYTYSGSPLAVPTTFFRETVGQAFTVQAAASGGVGSLTWSSPDLPAGLTLSPSGTISGTLTTAGAVSAHLIVQDQANHSVTSLVTFSVLAAGGRRVRLQADFDNDGRSDYAVWRPTNGTWYVIESSTGQAATVPWGLPGDVPVTGDFDGDGKTDYAVWRPSSGTWYVIHSSIGEWSAVQWGLPTDMPVTGDFDGDGKTDYAVWRPSNGTWYVISSVLGTWSSVAWGLPGDVPVAGDFDGDGKTDIAVWRPSNGTWYIISSVLGTWYSVPWGLPGDVPVSGDFDGDGKTDCAVWRPSNGTWYVLPSSAPGTAYTVPWGLPGDVPVAGDFDGDGKTDYAVWRPSDGTWYVLPSSAPGTWYSTPFGLPGDIPK